MLRFNIINAYTRAIQREEKYKRYYCGNRNIQELPTAKGYQHPIAKGRQHYPKSHLSVSSLHSRSTETSRKVSTAEAACPYPDETNTIEHQWQDQKATQSTPTLPNSILIGWTYHHRTAVAGQKFHTVDPHPSNLHTYHLHTSIISE